MHLLCPYVKNYTNQSARGLMAQECISDPRYYNEDSSLQGVYVVLQKTQVYGEVNNLKHAGKVAGW